MHKEDTIIGITTNPKGCKKSLELKHPKGNWKGEGTYKNRPAAERKKDLLAEKNGYEAHHGGRNPKSKKLWTAYIFNKKR